MTKSQITELLAALKAEADKQNMEIDESFIEQLLVLKRVGKEQRVDPEAVGNALNKISREALREASRSGQARISADPLIRAYALNDSPWEL